MIYSRNVQYFCCISCWVECATFLNRFISSISSSDLIYYCWRRAFFPSRSAEVGMWTSLLIIFLKRWGTRKRKIFLPFPKWCLCVLNVISSYMKCLNIYSNHYKSLRRKNIDMCQYVVNGNDYHLNIKRVGKRENPFVSRVFCTNGKCLQASAFRLSPIKIQ